ncbi:DUF4232 domain-containing protein [Streptomyces litchfieldiae]|uniref:DUF4232 domain-containing protein n=1 Tax=Streptomyces litchfieldiae TaxID=3075543 RepID=A0ABU2MQM1_9ACTN|nr:DUF4232 domain-containing protein [Streptomyces sp. DSM 44938]MDT0343840.1 DUF4232 domain-containing protein [Streptomyces sp. DSM 44938]
MVSHPLRTVCAAAIAVLVVAGCAESNDSQDSAADDTAAARDDRSGERTPATEEDGAPSETPADSGDSGSESAAPESDAPTPAEEPAWCSHDALTASVTPLEPGAGNRYAALVLTNSASEPCRTQGWPGLQLTAGDGDEIPTTTVRDDSAEPVELTLEPGGSAWARLHWSAVPGAEDPADGCGPDPAVLNVIPPDEYSPTTASWELGSVCGAGRIEAQPLAEGTGPAR